MPEASADDQSRRVGTVIVIPNSFFGGSEGVWWGVGGIRHSCSRQYRLSQMPDEIKCDWRDHADDGKGPR